jgi:hypothetical protein
MHTGKIKGNFWRRKSVDDPAGKFQCQEPVKWFAGMARLDVLRQLTRPV